MGAFRERHSNPFVIEKSSDNHFKQNDKKKKANPFFSSFPSTF